MSDPLDAKIAENTEDERPARNTAPERTRVSRKPGSLGYAAAIAGSCLAASLTLGLGLIHVPLAFQDAPPTVALDPPFAASDFPVTSGPTAWSTTTTRTSSGGPPSGFVRATGPADLKTVLPDSFTVLAAGVGVFTARDSLDPEVEVRFGGAPPEGDGPLLESIGRAAGATSSNRSGYVQLELGQARHGSFAAVDWEFEYRTEDGGRWSRAHYWRAGGIEYVLLVQTPPHRRADGTRLLETMIAHSEPS